VLIVALISLIFARSVDQTIFYRLAQIYSNYVWYLGGVILPVAFLVVSWPVVWWKMAFTGQCATCVRACGSFALLAFTHLLGSAVSWVCCFLGLLFLGSAV